MREFVMSSRETRQQVKQKERQRTVECQVSPARVCSSRAEEK